MPDKPSEIPSIRGVLEQIEQLSKLGRALPLFRPLLALMGVNSTDVENGLRSLGQLRQQALDLAKTMDRFNELLGPCCWVAYDSMNSDVAKAAVDAAGAGRMADAEDILTRHYSGDQVEIQLRTLWVLQSFRPRMRLAELALTDYREGRYHACIPVILALLDGMVNELGNHGFFSSNVDLTAWDSIAACSTGLNQLKSILFKPRKKTTEEPLEAPYRNGIHHGMDLRYDTALVAAKCWAALFATADWARRIEQGVKDAPAPEPEPTWSDVFALVQRNTADQEKLGAWRPREVIDVENAKGGSPEAALSEFLNAWKTKNYGAMATRVEGFTTKSPGARAGRVREFYRWLELDEFVIVAVLDKAPSLSEITARGRGVQYGRAFDRTGTFRLFHADKDQRPVIHGESGGMWFVMTWNPWEDSTATDAVV